MYSESTYSLRKFVKKIRKIALIAGAIIGLVLLTVLSRAIGFGFLAGVAISIINFQLMAVDAYDIEGKVPQKAQKFIIGKCVLRYVIMFGFIALLVTRTNCNIIATFIGLFFIQIIIVGGQLLNGISIAYTKLIDTLSSKIRMIFTE